MEEKNCSRTTYFIILGFQGIPETFFFSFILFFFVYLLTVFSNIVIILLVKTDSHLHSPMYFFISNLSVLEIAYISSTLPNLMVGIVSGNKSISFTGCIIQLSCFSCLGGTENVLLAFMAYDRYLAICNPLKYTMIMSPKMCTQLACLSWSLGFIIAMAAILLVVLSCFCGPNIIEHFLCESTPLLQLSCTDVSIATLVLSISTSILTLSSVFFTMISYCFIIHTIIKIPSTTGKKKAMSTCASHFTAVIFFYTSVCVMYVHPSGSNPSRNKIAAVFYGIITPLLNPFVYSLRNKDMKNALYRALKKLKKLIF
ncbi:olfactory receptor 6B1-like [Dendropsophus ebraccatus]|uniref:olfactory receptor 6B1-like n=1 Tax=Dendropsophus ebraccatus TaxID=150705 RepID=UPI0038319A90